jgi:hypothetical protein
VAEPAFGEPLKFERADWSLFRTVEGLQQRAGVPKRQLRRIVVKPCPKRALCGLRSSSRGSNGTALTDRTARRGVANDTQYSQTGESLCRNSSVNSYQRCPQKYRVECVTLFVSFEATQVIFEEKSSNGKREKEN